VCGGCVDADAAKSSNVPFRKRREPRGDSGNGRAIAAKPMPVAADAIGVDR
jgi:hypothetical protein